MVIDRIDEAERRARIEQLIEKYRAAKQRRLLQRAMRRWRNTEARHQFVERETRTESTDAFRRLTIQNPTCSGQFDGGADTRNTMLKEMTRSKLIQAWSAAVTLAVVASIAWGASVTVSTGALLLALTLVPPAIVLMLWPGPQPATAMEVLYGSERQG